MSYYIGIDGGGTKTAYALFDEKKNIVAMVKGPGSNHENMENGFDEAADIIWAGIKICFTRQTFQFMTLILLSWVLPASTILSSMTK